MQERQLLSASHTEHLERGGAEHSCFAPPAVQREADGKRMQRPIGFATLHEPPWKVERPNRHLSNAAFDIRIRAVRLPRARVQVSRRRCVVNNAVKDKVSLIVNYAAFWNTL